MMVMQKRKKMRRDRIKGIGNMKIGINKFVFIIITVFTLSSCVKETTIFYGAGEKSLIRIATRGTFSASDPDEKISGFRVIAIDRTMNIVRSNLFFSDANLSNIISFSLYVGTYDFVFIANEPEGAVRDALNAVTTKADLAGIQFPASRFNSDDDIPMLLTVDNVAVLSDDQGIRVNGGEMQSQWTVRMERMGVRFDMTLKSVDDISSIFSGIEISNMPDAVSLSGVYSGSATTSRVYSYLETRYFSDTIIDGYAWAVNVHRIIIPPNVFSMPDDPDRAVKLTALLEGVSPQPWALIGLDVPNNNFTLPPNRLIFIRSNIKYQTEISLTTTVIPWTTIKWGSSMGDR